MSVTTTGRFSSQMLTYLGTQRTVKGSITPVNTYKYQFEASTYPDPATAARLFAGSRVVGAYTASDYDRTRCFYIDRGASDLYASTMTALTVDIAKTLGVSTQFILQKMADNITFSDDAYAAMNILRDMGNQLGKATVVDNRNSLQAREILS